MNKFIKLDIRVSRTLKEYFEQAAKIGGFQSLTDFLLTAASEKAEVIIERRSTWSEHDRKIFFDAIVNPPAPNARLRLAMKRLNEFNPKKY